MKKILYAILFILPLISAGTVSAQNDFISAGAIPSKVEISIYPQPSNGPLNIAFSEVQLMNPRILVYDLLGNLVADQEAEKQTGNVYSISLSNQKPGYYFIKILSEESSITRRITIKP